MCDGDRVAEDMESEEVGGDAEPEPVALATDDWVALPEGDALATRLSDAVEPDCEMDGEAVREGEGEGLWERLGDGLPLPAAVRVPLWLSVREGVRGSEAEAVGVARALVLRDREGLGVRVVVRVAMREEDQLREGVRVSDEAERVGEHVGD